MISECSEKSFFKEKDTEKGQNHRSHPSSLENIQNNEETNSLLTDAIQKTDFAAPEGTSPWHVSHKTPKHTWINDISGILAAINANGIELYCFRTQIGIECNFGFNASTQDGDLVFISG